MNRNTYWKSYAGVVISTIAFCSSYAFADKCPTPMSKVDPQIAVSIKFDQKSKIYKYSYTLKNGKSGQLPIDLLLIRMSYRSGQDFEEKSKN